MQFPTFRAYPLQPECDNWCEFPVKDRPNAVVQWLMAAEQHPELIQGAWLLMLESDYVWMKPLKVGRAQLPSGRHAWIQAMLRMVVLTVRCASVGTPQGNETRPGVVPWPKSCSCSAQQPLALEMYGAAACAA